MSYLPYRKRDGTTARDALTHPHFASHGYAAVRVDMRGNGDSEGLMEDEYSEQELQDAVDVIAWLAAQPLVHRQGRHMGISWGDFNSLQVATKQPLALKAIITLCSTDDRYAAWSCLCVRRAGASRRSKAICWSSGAISARPLLATIVDPRTTGPRASYQLRHTMSYSALPPSSRCGQYSCHKDTVVTNRVRNLHHVQ